MRPIYDYGDEVRVLRNVRNDGTFPGPPTGALLVRRGSTGYVRDVGRFLQDQIIYSVHFIETDRIVGCREEELQLASDPWTPSRFESREKVVARIALGRGGRVLVEQGRVGEVMKVLREPATGDRPLEVAYHVLFPDCSLLQIPESALEAVPVPEPSPDSPAEQHQGPGSVPARTSPTPQPASPTTSTRRAGGNTQPVIAEQSP